MKYIFTFWIISWIWLDPSGQNQLEQQYMLSVLHNQYHVCWCTGYLRSQGINRHGIDSLEPEYFVCSIRRVNMRIGLTYVNAHIHLTSQCMLSLDMHTWYMWTCVYLIYVDMCIHIMRMHTYICEMWTLSAIDKKKCAYIDTNSSSVGCVMIYVASYIVSRCHTMPKYHWCYVNSLTPGRPGCHFKTAIFNLVLLIGIFTSSKDDALRWMPRNLTDDKSTLVQVIAWCRQATSHYLSQCWPSSMWPYGVTRPQWVKEPSGRTVCWHTSRIISANSSTI